jgi:hypothetical protein
MNNVDFAALTLSFNYMLENGLIRTIYKGVRKGIPDC